MEKTKHKRVKDKKIRAFKTAIQAVSGFERIVKKYIHSKNSGGVWAYIRHLSERERYAAKAVQSLETMLFEVAHSPKLTDDLYIEFAGRTYRVVSIDPYEFDKTDLVIRAEEVAPPVFDCVEWGNYNDKY